MCIYIYIDLQVCIINVSRMSICSHVVSDFRWEIETLRMRLNLYPLFYYFFVKSDDMDI